MNCFKLHNSKEVLIVGAGHGIGLGIVSEILSRNKEVVLHATFRDKDSATPLFQNQTHPRLIIHELDPCYEDSVSTLANNLKGKEFDLIINSVGLLHNSKISPEKSFKSFKVENFLELMKINASVSALIFKYFEASLSKKNISAFVGISAKVGSIEDNNLGGWYSYRSSKAAMNMLLKCISIEAKRKRKDCIVLAIHPGTTDTELSHPFSNNISYKIHSIEETANNILNVIEGKSLEDSGHFYSWDGEELPW